jgi:hypothetical protein
MSGELLIGQLENGDAIAVPATAPYFCVAGKTPADARLAAARAQAFHESSAKLRPAPAVKPVKPDYVRVPRTE